MVHHGTPWGWSGIFYPGHGDAGYSNRGLAMGIALLLMIGLVTAFGVCWLIVRKRRRTCRYVLEFKSKIAIL